ncbi:restriction endonuclease subunit S [Vibrio cholerae]|nr:restriction endonuclease subunit S [Vibrio cholerae]
MGTLGDYIKVQGGFAYKSKDFQDSGANKVLKIKNVRFGHVDYGDTAYISDTLAKETQAWSTNEGDILISMTGSGPNAPQSLVGRVARVWENEDKAWINQRVGRIVLRKENTINPDFVYYLLSQKSSQDFLVSNSSGSANQANISGKTIEMLPCPIVSFEESSRIASTLIALDKKILLNRQINQTLEQMAQTLFKSWFVDFDPVIDNALDAGFFEQDWPIPDELQHRAEARKAVRESEGFKPLPDDVRQLFPDAFEESELGWVPKGWESGILSDLLVLQRGFDLPKSKRTDGPFPLMAASGQDGTHNEGKVRGPGVVTGRSGKLGVVNLVIEDFWPLNTTLWIKEYPRSNPYHAYFFLQTIPLEQFNSGSAVPTLNRNHVHNRPITLPSQDVLNKYADLVKDNFTQILNRRIQSETLEKLRDTLLPKLISGELRLDDVELAVEQEAVSAEQQNER